jgi:hypothetical protein
MTIKKHIFVNLCVDFDELLKEADIDKMLKEAAKQSKTEEAKIRASFSTYKDYAVDEQCPMYFGMFTEWLAWHFLNHYGHLFNVQNMEMTASVGTANADYGIDGQGMSVKIQKMASSGRQAVSCSPVYLQVKGTLNKTKLYAPNDGSRLTNFSTYAMSSAIKSGYAYQSRYIIFTTGAGIHYTLDAMSNNMFEVIDYKKIKTLLNNDTVFLNKLRESVGLVKFPVKPSQVDAEFFIEPI